MECSFVYWSFRKRKNDIKPLFVGYAGEFSPSILEGLEIGFFRMIQLGGEGRPSGFNTWMDAFLSQDNYGANTGRKMTDRLNQGINLLELI